MEKRLIVLTGIPGSGKSTYATSFAQQNKNAFIVSSDQIRLELFGRLDDFSNEELVFEQFEKLIIEKSLTYNVVIADSSATTNVRRLSWADKFRPYFQTLDLVYFKVSFFKAIKQNKKRTHVVPFKDMIEMKKAFEKPSKEVKNKYDNIIIYR